MERVVCFDCCEARSGDFNDECQDRGSCSEGTDCWLHCTRNLSLTGVPNMASISSRGWDAIRVAEMKGSRVDTVEAGFGCVH